MQFNNATGTMQPQVIQERLSTKQGRSSFPGAGASNYRQSWKPSGDFCWCAVGAEELVAAISRAKARFEPTQNVTAALREPLCDNQHNERNTRPCAGSSVREQTGPRTRNSKNVYRSYRAAIDTAAKEVMWNPMGKLDEKLFVPKIWRERQIYLNRRGAQKIAVGVESILIAQNVFAPVHYVLNKALGNGRVHSEWSSTTTGAMAAANIKSFANGRIKQGVVGGLVPSLSRLLPHLGALAGAGIGHLVNSVNGNNDAVAYAAWGARIGMYAGWGITQGSIGVNFVLKLAIALQPVTALVILTAALLLAVRWAWAAPHHDQALARAAGTE